MVKNGVTETLFFCPSAFKQRTRTRSFSVLSQILRHFNFSTRRQISIQRSHFINGLPSQTAFALFSDAAIVEKLKNNHFFNGNFTNVLRLPTFESIFGIFFFYPWLVYRCFFLPFPFIRSLKFVRGSHFQWFLAKSLPCLARTQAAFAAVRNVLIR